MYPLKPVNSTTTFFAGEEPETSAHPEVARLREENARLKMRIELAADWLEYMGRSKSAATLRSELATAPEESVSKCHHHYIKGWCHACSAYTGYEEPVIQDSRTTESDPVPTQNEWREVGPLEVSEKGDEIKLQKNWVNVPSNMVGVMVGGLGYRFRTRRPLPKQEMPLEMTNDSTNQEKMLKSNKNYWANLWADLSRESIKRAEKAEAEVARLREAFELMEYKYIAVRSQLLQRGEQLDKAIDIANTLSCGGIRACRELHHGKKDRHEIGEVCPVEERLEKAVSDLARLKIKTRLAPAQEEPVSEGTRIAAETRSACNDMTDGDREKYAALAADILKLHRPDIQPANPTCSNTTHKFSHCDCKEPNPISNN